jgi:hypothetical protein
VALDINDTSNRIRYTATAAQTAFSVPFEFYANSDIKAYKNGTLLTLTTDYTLTGAGSSGARTLTLVAGASLSDDILIIRDLPVRRIGDFPVSGVFDVASLNTQLDQMTMMIRDLEARLDQRVIRVAVTDRPETMSELPVMAERASRVMGFDSSGNPEALDPSGFGAQITVGPVSPPSPEEGDLWVDTN